jgi:hypothetical protein
VRLFYQRVLLAKSRSSLTLSDPINSCWLASAAVHSACLVLAGVLRLATTSISRAAVFNLCAKRQVRPQHVAVQPAGRMQWVYVMHLPRLSQLQIITSRDLLSYRMHQPLG